MQPLRPATKAGIVFGGFVAAFVVAGVAVWIRQSLTDGPDAQASSGMHAFGDLILGIAVFGLGALGPFVLGLYWLRPYAPFWRMLSWGAVVFALTGPLAPVVSGWLRQPAGNWAILGDARIGLMPVSALAILMCGMLAPQPKARWLLIAAALLEGGLFAGIVLVKFVLP